MLLHTQIDFAIHIRPAPPSVPITSTSMPVSTTSVPVSSTSETVQSFSFGSQENLAQVLIQTSYMTESTKQVLSAQNIPIHFIISISFSVWVIQFIESLGNFVYMMIKYNVC